MFAGIPQSLTGTVANSGLSTSLITGSNSDFPDLQPQLQQQQQKNLPVVSESLALSGLAGMGMPTSPVSISSAIVNSMVNQQGNSSLSRLEQQQVPTPHLSHLYHIPLLYNKRYLNSGSLPTSCFTEAMLCSESCGGLRNGFMQFADLTAGQFEDL